MELHPAGGKDQHRHGPAGHEEDRHGEEALADLLDLDAEVLRSYLDEVTGWVRGLTAVAPRAIVDVGAGTGSGVLALARRFERARMVAIDQSPLMLTRVQAAALAHGLQDRVRVIEADLDDGWPDVGVVDLAWAASSLHHAKDPGYLLASIYAALDRGGLLVVIEMDAMPRFLPDDIGIGRPGLEARCHEAMAQAGWNAHPNWAGQLEHAGFTVAEERTFTFTAQPAQPAASRYAHGVFARVRDGLADWLTADDVDVLDRLLTADSSDSVLRRRDVTVRGSRTAWAARRPGSGNGAMT